MDYTQLRKVTAFAHNTQETSFINNSGHLCTRLRILIELTETCKKWNTYFAVKK
jgi:hypothetical protein